MFEATQRIGRAEDFLGDDLDRDHVLHARVSRFEYLAHSPFGNPVEDRVLSKRKAFDPSLLDAFQLIVGELAVTDKQSRQLVGIGWVVRFIERGERRADGIAIEDPAIGKLMAKTLEPFQTLFRHDPIDHCHALDWSRCRQRILGFAHEVR
ncbi:MAG: hypothetical protein MI757_01075 [Pirellulales bacterium]|nr:hypothetical protein [Pirellulales bacterium]